MRTEGGDRGSLRCRSTAFEERCTLGVLRLRSALLEERPGGLNGKERRWED